MTTIRTRALPATIILAAVLIAALGAFAGATRASLRPPAQPSAVATINIDIVLQALDEKSKLEGDLQAEISSAEAQLQELTDRLKNIQEELELGAITPGTDAYIKIIGQAIELNQQLRARQQVLQETIALKQGATISHLYGKIREGAAKIASREGYDVVMLDESKLQLPPQLPANAVRNAILDAKVIYAYDSTDISNDVVTLLNNEFQAP